MEWKRVAIEKDKDKIRASAIPGGICFSRFFFRLLRIENLLYLTSYLLSTKPNFLYSNTHSLQTQEKKNVREMGKKLIK